MSIQEQEIVGKQIAPLQVPSPISYVDLLRKIVEEYSLHDIKNNVILSVNEEFCGTGDTLDLKSEDEIAVIPPLSGG